MPAKKAMKAMKSVKKPAAAPAVSGEHEMTSDSDDAQPNVSLVPGIRLRQALKRQLDSEPDSWIRPEETRCQDPVGIRLRQLGHQAAEGPAKKARSLPAKKAMKAMKSVKKKPAAAPAVSGEHDALDAPWMGLKQALNGSVSGTNVRNVPWMRLRQALKRQLDLVPDSWMRHVGEPGSWLAPDSVGTVMPVGARVVSAPPQIPQMPGDEWNLSVRAPMCFCFCCESAIPWPSPPSASSSSSFIDNEWYCPTCAGRMRRAYYARTLGQWHATADGEQAMAGIISPVEESNDEAQRTSTAMMDLSSSHLHRNDEALLTSLAQALKLAPSSSQAHLHRNDGRIDVEEQLMQTLHQANLLAVHCLRCRRDLWPDIDPRDVWPSEDTTIKKIEEALQSCKMRAVRLQAMRNQTGMSHSWTHCASRRTAQSAVEAWRREGDPESEWPALDGTGVPSESQPEPESSSDDMERANRVQSIKEWCRVREFRPQ